MHDAIAALTEAEQRVERYRETLIYLAARASDASSEFFNPYLAEVAKAATHSEGEQT